jgi:hypothetical protein
LVICLLEFTVFWTDCTVFFCIARLCICFFLVLSVLPPSDNSIAVSSNNNNNNNNNNMHFFRNMDDPNAIHTRRFLEICT